MPSSALINISTLLDPIDGDTPVGNDLRLDPAYITDYSQIKDARRAARDAERNNMFDGDNSEALEHWHKIFTLAPKVLAEQTKDLEIACWLTEALVRKAGFQGLKDGFSLIRQLLETYWESGIYPTPDEDGIETRVAPIAGLNGEGADGVLLSPIRNSEITEDGSMEAYNFAQYKQALDISRISDERSQNSRIEQVGFTLEDIEKAVAQSSDVFYSDLLDDIDISLNEYRTINTLLIEYCGTYDAPPTSKIIELLEDAKSAIKHVAKLKLPTAPAEELVNDLEETNMETENPPQSSQSTTTKVVVSNELNSREDAFKQLNTIAEYFIKNEPHSPVSYMLTKAVKWGNMPLDELMRELIPDSSSRELYTALTGVNVGD
ncbi:type VI secretion system protein TssA [Psychromonas sp.]|nr:type VI secretion system protein TssA [Psychromonas sp.]